MKKYTGTMPDGEFGKNTKIEFCCRTDGFAAQAIFLPTDIPFYLFAYAKECQAVHSMYKTKEVIGWDEQSTWSVSALEGSHPFDTSPDGKNHKIHYCYYSEGGMK